MGILVISGVSLVGGLYFTKTIPDFTFPSKTDREFTFSPSPLSSPNISSAQSGQSIKLSPSVNKTSTPKPASKFTPRPSVSPAAAPVTNPAPSNPYDLNSPTGSVKVMVKPGSGILAYTPQAELATVSGFKVLDGRSTDKITLFGKDRTDELRGEILFSTVPPGPYKVRISYNGSWSDQKDISVSSAQLAYVEFSVAGVAPTPAPTPRPKPVCSILVLSPGGGNAPFAANVCVGNNSNPYQAVQQQFIDYDGNGSWDFQSSDFGCQSYTYQNPGTFYPKAKIIGSSGDESDVCQTTVTIH